MFGLKYDNIVQIKYNFSDQVASSHPQLIHLLLNAECKFILYLLTYKKISL